MISIDRHIEYLLIGHDCVIVPGLGAFIAHYQPAHFRGDTFVPPMRSLGFNPDIRHNDGLLVTSVARRNSLSYDSAVSAVGQGVNALRHQLDIDGEFTIGRIGRLVKGADGIVGFEPEAMSVASMCYRGLPSVKALTLEQRKQAAEQAEKQVKKPAEVIYIPVSRTIFKVAASICALLILGFVCSTPRVPDEAVISMASLSAPGISAPEYENIYAEPAVPAGFELIIANPSASDRGVSNVAVKAAETESLPKPVSKDGDFCVVVGSFNTAARAAKYIAYTGNSSLRVLEQDGHFRVYAATAATEDEAKAIAWSKDMQRKYPGAWVTQK